MGPTRETQGTQEEELQDLINYDIGIGIGVEIRRMCERGEINDSEVRDNLDFRAGVVQELVLQMVTAQVTPRGQAVWVLPDPDVDPAAG